MKYVDLHCDTLTVGDANTDFLTNDNNQISLDKLVKGDCFLQCFSVFVNGNRKDAFAVSSRYVERYEKYVKTANLSGIKTVLTFEGGNGIENGKQVEYMAKHGVKIYGITWNNETPLGYPCGEKGGLTLQGKNVVENVISKGVLPDVSHLSDDGIKDVLSICKTANFPVVSTHTLSREVFYHKRNISGDLAKKIADLGGVIGVCFVREFVGNKSIFTHIKRLINVCGEDGVAIGSDFDGTENPIIPSAKYMPRFFDRLSTEVGERVAEKIARKNAERIIFQR